MAAGQHMKSSSPGRLDIDTFRGMGLSEAEESGGEQSPQEDNETPTESATTKLTEREKKWIEKQAEGAGISQAEFIRRKLFSRPVEPLAEQHLLGRLTALGAQVEMMCSELEKMKQEEMESTVFRWLREVESKVKKITTDLDPRLR